MKKIGGIEKCCECPYCNHRWSDTWLCMNPETYQMFIGCKPEDIKSIPEWCELEEDT